MGTLGVQGSIYLYLRLRSESGHSYTGVEWALYIMVISVKVGLDFIAFIIFFMTFRYFLDRKRQSRRREALKLTPFNKFILSSVYGLMLCQVLGTLFTFSNACIALTESYLTKAYTDYRLIMGDIFFPVRDCVQVLFLSYLFFFQSKNQRDSVSLSRLNEQYYRNLSQVDV
jgi:amino acid transporter